jgi:hypothetical protein
MWFEHSEPGDLLVGRIRNDDPHFVVVRVEPHPQLGDDRPAVVILKYVAQQPARPSFEHLENNPAALNLGKDWFFDVSVVDHAPKFSALGNDAVLVRSGASYFVRLADGLFLAVDDCKIELERPFLRQPFAAWETFSVRLKLPGEKGESVEICSWP